MKTFILLVFTATVLSVSDLTAGNPGTGSATGSVVLLDNNMFKQKVFNYEANKTWKYEGTMPAIIDFYADWCGPCRMMSPLIDEIAKKYAGRIVVYKVDTDKERLLSQSLGISSLPTLLFIPVKGQPQASLGAIPRESLEKAINEVLMIKK